MIEYNEENMEKLARKVVDDWDMDTLMNFAIERIYANYKNNKCDFEGDLEYFPNME